MYMDQMPLIDYLAGLYDINAPPSDASWKDLVLQWTFYGCYNDNIDGPNIA